MEVTHFTFFLSPKGKIDLDPAVILRKKKNQAEQDMSDSCS